MNIVDYDEIKEITMTIHAPIKVLSLPELTNCHVLQELGVQRFSFGNALSDKIISFLDSNAAQLMELQDTSLLYDY